MSFSANKDIFSDSFMESCTAPVSSNEAPASVNDKYTHSTETDCSDGCQVPSAIPYLASSIDCGHRGLISAVGTTEKFTHKWPRPKMMKLLDPQPTGAASEKSHTTAATSLEEGQGLGINRIASWTIFKCLLLFSVLSVFAYGCAGLIMAIMTWFNSKSVTLLLQAAFNCLCLRPRCDQPGKVLMSCMWRITTFSLLSP